MILFMGTFIWQEYFYLVIYYTSAYPSNRGVGVHQRQGKKSEKNEENERATDALIGGEEQDGNRREQREINREWFLNPATLYHSVASYDAQGSYGEPYLFYPSGPNEGGRFSYLVIRF